VIPLAVASDYTEKVDYDCCVCYDEGEYSLSTGCGNHFMCAGCIRGTLEATMEAGQFPAACPMYGSRFWEYI
jgi:hypothetical protein